jgi:hypothetical protein
MTILAALDAQHVSNTKNDLKAWLHLIGSALIKSMV